MRTVTAALASVLLASCGAPEVAAPLADESQDDLARGAETAYDVCSKAIRSVAKNPSASRIPEGALTTDGDGAFIIDWGMGSGLALQNAFGAMLDTTATCVVESGLVTFLVLDEKAMSFDDLYRNASGAEPFAAEGISDSGDSSQWEPSPDIEAALQDARMKAVLRRPVVHNTHTDRWTRRAYVLGPMSISSRPSQLTDDCVAEGRTVKFYVIIGMGETYETQAAAEQNRLTPSDSSKYDVELGYCLTEAGWHYRSGTYSGGMARGSFQIALGDIDYVPMSGLVPFIGRIPGT